MVHPAGAPSAEGFTRFEALVTSVCLGVLGVLSLPLIAGNAEQGRAAVCVDNLRRLAVALTVYASDEGWYPPNPDDGNTTPGSNWVPGQAGVGGSSEFDSGILSDPQRSLLYRYLDPSVGVSVFACPSDQRRGRAPEAAPDAPLVTAARSVSLNVAVGTNPYAQTRQATDGAWLDSNHGHTLGLRWRTYGRPDQVVGPSPSGLFTFIEEDALSLNDGVMAMGMQMEEWLDWPATRHGMSGTLSYADGHAEFRRWIEPSTYVARNLHRLRVPGSVDFAWLRERTSDYIRR